MLGKNRAGREGKGRRSVPVFSFSKENRTAVDSSLHVGFILHVVLAGIEGWSQIEIYQRVNFEEFDQRRLCSCYQEIWQRNTYKLQNAALVYRIQCIKATYWRFKLCCCKALLYLSGNSAININCIVIVTVIVPANFKPLSSIILFCIRRQAWT